MFFPLSKILGFFALPSNLVIVTGLIGVALPKPGVTTNVFTGARPAIRPMQ